MNREVVIVAYGRSAVCRARKGSFAGTHPIEYSAQVLKGVLDKIPQLDRADIEDVIMGCAVQHYKTSMNIAKSVVARAELPECVAGHTINRFCSSGLQAIATAANAIAAGQGDVIVAGGVEDMSGTFEPYPEEYQDPWLNEHAPGAYMAMGITAENVVKKYGLTRTEMDQMAVDSHRKAAKAQKEGKLAPSIIPVTVVDENGNEKVVTEDEGIRPNTNLETLATLKPCFIPERYCNSGYFFSDFRRGCLCCTDGSGKSKISGHQTHCETGFFCGSRMRCHHDGTGTDLRSAESYETRGTYSR